MPSKPNKIVFITAVDLNNTEVYKQHCIESWQKWCNKNSIELFVCEELHEATHPRLVRYHAFKILKSAGIKFNQIALVDLDTCIHPECDNFFELTNGELAATLDYDGPWWYTKSLEFYQPHFEGIKLSFDDYFNSGFIVAELKHEQFFEEIIKFAKTTEIDSQSEFFTKYRPGYDQTPLNFLAKKLGVKVTILPKRFNLTHPSCKLSSNLEKYLDIKAVYHFNSMDNEEREFHMKGFNQAVNEVSS